ncbi:DUF485 domain-containing protein [Nocardia farcinica]|uniref:DUF485 domain-containing protein n=1 Tax=Nocardia farcinica (strain IFM 10152) TaxID=247156 RepID=Q5YVU5_NOCFA|nr:DUF485 domain-containing protein [Nocardia farcinica]BAD57696.1 hypothetical protein NFA_28490 [Nocardia farcinica IFM 10152]
MQDTPALAPPSDDDLDAAARERAALILRLSAIVLVLFFPLPVLGGFTSLLDTVVFSGVTLAWIYAAAQFVVAVVVARYYMSRAAALESRTAGEGTRA